MKKTLTLAAAALLFSCFNTARGFAAPYGAGFYDTSEYMMGKVTVNIVFVQSDGTLDPRTETNNWTTNKKNQVITGLQNAMAWWAAREPKANLAFTFQSRTLTTKYEPINHDTTDEGLWIADVMGKLGYSESDYFDRVYHYDNDLRTANGTDWAFTLFMVDSEVDLDGEFAAPDYGFAYAYVGGPFMVMTYDNDSYGISVIAGVAAHETGHIFYALDEYYQDSSNHCTASDRSGYLNIVNANCENSSGIATYESIMRGQIQPYTDNAISPYARQMVGWRDTNSNGILDINDLPPTTVLYAYSPDPTTNATPTYYGMAHSTTAYTNSNPYSDWSPARTPDNISINRIAGVEYKVDTGAWLAAAPRDAAFDQNIESFTFTTSALAVGPHTIQARAKDNFGAYDATPESDSLTVVNPQPSDIAYVYDGLGVDISFVSSRNALSANWGASSFTGGVTYEYAIGTTQGGTEISTWTSAGTNRSVTRSGLNLADDTMCYFGVRAVGAGPVYSNVAVSDGQRVDVSSPTASIQITSPLPAKTGPLLLKLIVTEANGLAYAPSLTFTQASGSSQIVNLSHLVSSTWTGSAFIESVCSTGTAVFTFKAADLVGNTGSVLTAGATFQIDTAVSGITGGAVVNSDTDTVTVPAGASPDYLVISISTVAPSKTSLANSDSVESRALLTHDLTREITAKTPAGLAVNFFNDPITIKLCYQDDNNDGYIDGDHINENLAGLYWLDETSYMWIPVPGAVKDTAANCISAPTSHLSIYSIRVADISESGMANLKAYPNPCYFSRSNLNIGGIPFDAQSPKIFIYNTAGELVRKLEPGDGIDTFNKAVWDGKNGSGQKAASGLYIYLAKTSNLGAGTGKFYIFW